MLLSFVATLAMGVAPTTEGGVTWVTNVDLAKEQAAKEGKHLLINFTGSDWCGWCVRLDEEVFSHDEFVQEASKHYVFLYLDFPRGEEPKSKVVDAELNDKLQNAYTVGGFPTIMVTDAELRPYGRTGYQEGGPAKYLENLAALRETGAPILDLLAAEKPTTELVSAAFPVMDEAELLNYPEYETYLNVAAEIDADGKKGWLKKIKTAQQNAKFMELVNANFGEGLTPDWKALATFLAEHEYVAGNAFVQIGMGCTQEYLIPEGKFAEAKAIFVRVKNEPMLAGNAQAQQQLQGMIDEMDTKAKEAASDDG